MSAYYFKYFLLGILFLCATQVRALCRLTGTSYASSAQLNGSTIGDCVVFFLIRNSIISKNKRKV